MSVSKGFISPTLSILMVHHSLVIFACIKLFKSRLEVHQDLNPVCDYRPDHSVLHSFLQNKCECKLESLKKEFHTSHFTTEQESSHG